MDFNRRVVIDTLQQPWVASPRPGVWRKPLAREAAERGHATSIVRYDAGASFSAHDHPLGEEILVLAGTFSDETGDYPAGTYFRNPEGFRHAPFSKSGCVILVKLHQFQAGDNRHVCIDTATARWLPGGDSREILELHQFNGESVALARWPAGAQCQVQVPPGGEEIYVLSGELIDELGRYPRGTWIRNPPMGSRRSRVERATLVWTKTGHLPAAASR